MKSEFISKSEEYITKDGLTAGAASLVEDNSILMVVRSGILKHTIPVALNTLPVTLNQDMKAIRIAPAAGDTRFFLRLIQGFNQIFLDLWSKQGATVESLETAAIRATVVPCPPLIEQSAIAEFLDRETGKIDALVAEQERLIALLKEKRQAVISHAVTKGLNPNAPMKDSGVPWLGEVPAHWEVKPLKFVATVQSGVAKGRDLTNVQTIEVPYLRVANVQDGYLSLDNVSMMLIGSDELARYLLRKGDILMNEGGDFDKLGRGQVWDAQINPCIHQNHVFAVRPYSVDPRWITLITSADCGRFFFMSRAKQSTNLASISSTNLMELPVCCPPPTECVAIISRIEVTLSALTQLNGEATRAITLLRERRAALISAAVTGKIDVRDTVVQPSSQAA